MLISFSVFSQGKNDKRINEKMKNASEHLMTFDFGKARKIYQEILEKKPGFVPAKRGLAVCAMGLDENEEAEKWLLDIAQNHTFFSQITSFELGRVYYRMGKYDEAIRAFESYRSVLKMPPNKFGMNGMREVDLVRKYAMQLDDAIFECSYARDSIPALGIGNITNLGDAINTEKNDYFPFLTNDESVLLFTRMITKNNEDFYVSTNENGNWTKGVRVGDGFNTDENEGMCTCTRDNIRLYFTACQRDNVDGTCDIQQAILKMDDSLRIDKIEKIDGTLNTRFWESQASISCDGKMMFFSSSRPGGYGKTDIYVSYIQKDGSWGEAKNVGANINTDDYEESPFITNDGKTLFFSSTGLLGMGEQDIYMSRLQPDGTWGKAFNLGNKVNTSYRELGFFLTADGRTGYFASDRPSGKGGLDIYRFSLSRPIKSDPITFVEGYVKDSISRTPIQTVIKTQGGEYIPTDENGRFFRCLPPGDFIVGIDESEYYPYRNNKMIQEWDNRTFFQVEYLLRKPEDIVAVIPEVPQPKPISKPNPKPVPIKEIPVPTISPISVYFAFDRSGLTLPEQEKLDEFIMRLKERPDLRLSLNAYCDFKGSNEYNFKLADNRALAVYNYLISNGIEQGRIRWVGYGEINDENPRWMNRRVDVIIID